MVAFLSAFRESMFLDGCFMPASFAIFIHMLLSYVALLAPAPTFAA
jgi:hypothetical protein